MRDPDELRARFSQSRSRKLQQRLEVLDEDGVQRFIARDTIVQIVLVAHTRPAYIDDKELLAFEREDMKRRSTLHEKVEKETTGNDDAHLWG